MGAEEYSSTVWERRLYASGFVGLAGGFGLELYRQVLLDPVVRGAQLPPDWLAPALLFLLVGSIATFAYAMVLNEFERASHRGLTAAVVCAQWGLPATHLLADVFGIGSPAGFLVFVAIGLHVGVASIVAVSLIR